MRRQYHCVFVCMHYVIVEKTEMMDVVRCLPNPFYYSLQEAKEMRQNLIEKGKLSEENSSVEGAHIIALCMN